jgi:hypothetical protein
MGKYEPLSTYLARQSSAELLLTFVDIERVIGAPLPPVARKHRAWWSNNPSNSVITRAWLDAGYRTAQVDMDLGKLVFRRQSDEPTGQLKGSRHLRSIGLLDRLRASLGGTVTVMPGVDLTAPTDVVWDAQVD